MLRPCSFESLSGRAFSACCRTEPSTRHVSRAPCVSERCSGRVFVESSTASPVFGWGGSLLRRGRSRPGLRSLPPRSAGGARRRWSSADRKERTRLPKPISDSGLPARPPISAFMREWVLSRTSWSGPGLGVVVINGERCWWAGPAPYPGCGARRFGAWASIRSAPAVRRVVCVERCGHSGFGWAQSHYRPAPVGGVMPIGELASEGCARTVHAATSWSRQRMCPSRSP